VPKAAVSGCSKNPLSKASLFDYLVGAGEKHRRDSQAKRFGSFEVYHQVDLGRLHYR
jgi:hypothetical protein